MSEDYLYRIETGVPLPPWRPRDGSSQKFKTIADRMRHTDSVVVNNFVECKQLIAQIKNKYVHSIGHVMDDNVRYRVWKLKCETRVRTKELHLADRISDIEAALASGFSRTHRALSQKYIKELTKKLDRLRCRRAPEPPK